ncbi:uncharacterized protein LOC116336955 [Contarinia nasturtii]|uniref:uncharacterized protein LOC116336955 n=1 Tax=Contarinia nasturtii TaxID=265458 RepID=UPI0012D45CB2|nr:uncharacterized protein LOC116336955 [Contarinia nasturtii]
MSRRSTRIAAIQSIETGKHLAPPKPKRRKLNHAKKQNGDSNSSTTILELNEHCFQEIFDWLSVNDLHSFGKTCTKLQKLAGCHFQQNYPTQSVQFCELCSVLQKFDGFEKYSKNITITICKECERNSINKNRDEQYQYINAQCNQSLKRIKFERCTLTACALDNIRTALNSVEELRISSCTAVDDLHECLLKHCPNLKILFIDNTLFSINWKWLHQTYPMLVHLQLIRMPRRNYEPMDLVLQFLEKNPNIRKLTVGMSYLEECVESLMETNIQLDELTIKEYSQKNEIPTSLINQLYERGFYKKINLLARDVVNVTDWEWNIYGLGKFYAQISTQPNSDYSNLVNIKELWPRWSPDIRRNVWPGHRYLSKEVYYIELDRFAKCMINLERIWLSLNLFFTFSNIQIQN